MTGLAFGAILGLGLALIVRAARGARPPLAALLAGLERGPTGPRSRASFSDRVGASLLGVIDAERHRRDLRVTQRSPERHAFEKLAAALAGASVPPLLVLVVSTNGIGVPAGGVVTAAAALALAGFTLPDLLLRDAAAERRRAFTAALSSYLDLVNVVLAGGAGTETALEAAAESGDGWAFAELRGALSRSRALRRSPWDCFAELGDDLGVAELQELSASVRLAGQQGARVRSSLAAKAASLRGHQLSRVEASAQSASERMAIPTVLLFLGFLLFVGYPAVAEILGTGAW
jgi:Flp pilus assembly protein TadB